MFTSKAMKKRDPIINKIFDFINSRMTVVRLGNQNKAKPTDYIKESQ